MLDEFYECTACNTIYKEQRKSLFEENPDTTCSMNEEGKFIKVKAQIAVMTHMALIDDDFDELEEKEIQKILDENEKISLELKEIHENVKMKRNVGNQVYSYLKEAKDKLSIEVLTDIIAKAAIVLLADGKIETDETIMANNGTQGNDYSG